MEAECGFNITCDRKDFQFAEIPVLDAEEFLLEVVVPLKRRQNR